MQPTKTRSLYKGEIKIEFIENPYHKYIVNGKQGIISVTAVTGILDKPALKFWACNMMEGELLDKLNIKESITPEVIAEAKKAHTKKTQREATSGSLVHEWAEAYILNQLEKKPKPEMPKDDRVLNGVLAFLKWVEEHQIRFLASELLVYSKEYNYAGLMDCKFTMGDEKHKIVHCGDFKTSSGIYNEMFYQVAGYEKADSQESGEVYGDQYIIRFDKDTGEFDFKSIPQIEVKKNYNAFLGLLAVKRREVELRQNNY